MKSRTGRGIGRALSRGLILVALLVSAPSRAGEPPASPSVARPFTGLLPAEDSEVEALDREVVRLIDAGRLAEGAPAATRLLALRTRQIGALQREVARRTGEGRHREALPVAERLLALRRTILGPDHPDTIQAVGMLAQVHRRLGDYRAAGPLFQQALALRERTLGGDHRLTFYARQSLAAFFQESGERDLAEPLLLRLLADAERSPGSGNAELLGCLNALAAFYRHVGEPARAEPLYRRALSIAEKESPEGSSDVAALLDNFAGVLAARGDRAAAELVYRRALSMSEAVHGPEHLAVGRILNNLASMEVGAGELDRAEAHFQRSLALREKLVGREHPDVATVLFNASVIPGHRGDRAGARVMLDRALSILEKAHGPMHPRVADVLDALSELRAASGEVKAAVELRTRASAIEDGNAAILLASGSEEQRRLYMERLRLVTSGTLSLHLGTAPADPAAAELALTTLLRRKGRVLDATADSLATLRRRVDPDVRVLLDRLTSINAQIAAQIAQAPAEQPLVEQRAGLLALDEERRAIEGEVSAKSKGFAREQQAVSVAGLRALLPEDAALVEIALYSPLDFQAKRRDERWRRARYAAYVLRRSGAITAVDLGEAEALDAAIKALREALADPNHDARPAARALDARVLAPLRPLLGDARRVWISPDGELTLLPFAALVDEQGRYALEQRSFSYLSSGRDLLGFGDAPAPRQGALLFAAPTFDTGAPPGDTAQAPSARRSIDMRDVSFRALSGAAKEARAIEEQLVGARLLLGASATEGALKAVRGPSLLHIATHGFFLPTAPRADELGALRRAAVSLPREPAAPLRAGLRGRQPPAQRRRGRHPHRARGVEPRSRRHRAGRPLGLRLRRGDGQPRRGRVRPAPRAGDRRRRHPGDEPVARRRRGHARSDDRLLRRAPRRRRTGRGDASRPARAARSPGDGPPLFLGQLHRLRRRVTAPRGARRRGSREGRAQRTRLRLRHRRRRAQAEWRGAGGAHRPARHDLW